MVHKNYKWNISKKKGIEIVNDTIHTILSENKENKINYEELVFCLNKRTENLTIKNNNKKKNITNFIKTVLGGLIYHIESEDNFKIINNSDGEIYITFDTFNINDWILVED